MSHSHCKVSSKDQAKIHILAILTPAMQYITFPSAKQALSHHALT